MITQISVYLENVHGSLRSLTKTLAEDNIDLLALSIADTANFGIVRLVVREEAVTPAMYCLKEAGFIAKKNDVICVSVPNRPAGLDTVLAAVEAAGASVEYMYSFNYSLAGSALMILRLADGCDAEKILRDGCITVVSQDEINRL